MCVRVCVCVCVCACACAYDVCKQNDIYGSVTQSEKAPPNGICNKGGQGALLFLEPTPLHFCPIPLLYCSTLSCACFGLKMLENCLQRAMDSS